MRQRQSAQSRYGHKDKKLIIYKEVSSQDKDGYKQTVYYPTHPGKLWAYVRQIGGEQYYAAMAHNVVEEMLFVVNWRPDLNISNTQTCFVFYKDQWYQIQRIDTFEGYKNNIQLYANTMKSPPEADKIKPYQG